MGGGRPIRRWWKAGAALAVAALGAGAAVAVASVPGSDGVIHACVNVTTTTGGAVVPNQSGTNLTIIDPSVGQHCNSDPAAPTQKAISWSVTGPQGPQGVPGPQGTAGANGAIGPTGSAGNGATNSVTIAPPLLSASVKPVAEAIIGSGDRALRFPVLAAEQAGVGAQVTGAGAGTAKTTFHAFSLTKQLDKASPSLFQLAATGKHIAKVTIEYAKPSAGKKYLKVTLTRVLISADQTQASAGAKASPHETITLNYSAIKWTYTQQKRSD